MIKQLAILSTALLAACCISCASAGDPISPGTTGRHCETWTSSKYLFWPLGNQEEEIFAWDVDLASVIVGPNPPAGQSTGDIWDRTLVLPEDPWNYCAGVSMRRTQDDGKGTPYCAWMWNDQPGLNQTKEVITQAERQVTSFGPCHNTFDFPRCDSMYFDGTYQSTTSVVELAVCYMICGKPGLEPGTMAPTSWDIGITIMTWETTVDPPNPTFPITEPKSRHEWRWGEEDNEPESVTDEYYPDIAYDPYTGDLYLVFTVNDTTAQTAVVYYRRYDHDGGTWSDMFPIHEDDHQGWTPRIDVGTMQSLPGVSGTQNIAGVAYSAYGQGDHEYGWHPMVVYWDTDEGDEEKGDLWYPLWNPTFWYDETLDSGLPQIDIGPESNSSHYGAVVYVQEMVPHIPGVNSYRSYEIDNLCQSYVCVDKNVPDNSNRILPSIAINHIVSGDYYASISFFRYAPGSNSLSPNVCRVDMSIPPGPLKFSWWEGINFTATGFWVPADITYINPGMSSSITVDSNNSYWAGFCDRVKWGGAATGVPSVAFGRTGN